MPDRVTVTGSEVWRDASGTYACPSCEVGGVRRGEPLARLRPDMMACPKCGVGLDWRTDLWRCVRCGELVSVNDYKSCEQHVKVHA